MKLSSGIPTHSPSRWQVNASALAATGSYNKVLFGTLRFLKKEWAWRFLGKNLAESGGNTDTFNVLGHNTLWRQQSLRSDLGVFLKNSTMELTQLLGKTIITREQQNTCGKTGRSYHSNRFRQSTNIKTKTEVRRLHEKFLLKVSELLNTTNRFVGQVSPLTMAELETNLLYEAIHC